MSKACRIFPTMTNFRKSRALIRFWDEDLRGGRTDLRLRLAETGLTTNDLTFDFLDLDGLFDMCTHLLGGLCPRALFQELSIKVAVVAGTGCPREILGHAINL